MENNPICPLCGNEVPDEADQYYPVRSDQGHHYFHLDCINKLPIEAALEQIFQKKINTADHLAYIEQISDVFGVQTSKEP